MEKRIKRKNILNAMPEIVWNTLTNPNKTKLFMFNCEAHSNWKVGSEIKWKGNFNGYESGEKGVILELSENEHLKYSSIDPNFGIEDIPENYLHITYDLKEVDGKTELTTTIENFNNDPERLGHVANGWDNIALPALEKIHNQ
ncbi:SRPBCC family protein [Tunicatimonas pelagia]|uniref:SRPBCC family protein n=1 Tax=Tunicatimonas pelagia TaxID=931531 RepID=UPI0026668C22|nr:SRPBCC family protein [Tunicatimonas pelagia]WKN42610.1 SRPBCC family protein [Tunicatimonas pelagia]